MITYKDVEERLMKQPYPRMYAIHAQWDPRGIGVIVVPASVDREEDYKNHAVFLSFNDKIYIDNLRLFLK